MDSPSCEPLLASTGLSAEVPTNATMDATMVIENDDSASDVSMSEDSDEEDQEPDSPTSQIIADQKDLHQTTDPDQSDEGIGPNKKRKLTESLEAEGQTKNPDMREDRKRLKPDDTCRNGEAPGILAKDRSLLPAELWHHIFTFCPPKTLGLLLRVNKSFNAYLDHSSVRPSVVPLANSTVPILAPDSIWRISKRLYNLPGMPLPLQGKSELEMWQLACGLSCQFCHKNTSQGPATPADQWHSGPGERGVMPIWPFGIRSCGSCLQKNSIKEIDLLLSSSIPSTLLTALPFIFLTNEFHIISPVTLQSGQQPGSVQITKLYSSTQVEEIRSEFDNVRAMGPATAEEWLKGLDGRGRERKNDAARWERWEVSGGISKMLNFGSLKLPLLVTMQGSGSASENTTFSSPSSTTNGQTPSSQTPGSLQLPASFPKKPVSQLPPYPGPMHNSFMMGAPPRFNSPSQNGLPPHPALPRPFPPAKHERTKEQVAEFKAARKTEIERRCMLLKPPITAGVLAHMPSFQAAIQIIQPLGDGAWEVLKPRLLSQREEAEQRESDRLAQTRVVQERFDSRRFPEQARSDSKDLVDREWDDIQAPLRARVGGYADEIIRDGWNNGEKVSYDTAPLFAAEVLIYVRKRFYAEVAKDEAAVRATGREPEMDPPDGPYTRKLILENMKWVFDTKIKPHTEPHRKELFLCHACEYAAKYYGFEGVIQHFAAKHTSALSFGSIVVHWKSEWPENPPFNPEPDSIKNFYGAGPSASVPFSSSGLPAQQNFGYGGYQPAPASGPIQASNPHTYQDSAAPYYGNSQYSDQYAGHPNGSYVPPQHGYPDSSQGYQVPPYSAPLQPGSMPVYNDMPQEYPQQGFGGQYNTQAQPAYPQPHSGPAYSTANSEASQQQIGYPPSSAQYGPSYSQQTPYIQNNYPQVPQRTEEYNNQIQHLARNAREVWNSIGGMKEVPGSLKVYTIIYHLLQRYRTAFQDDPPLSMIVDGLSNNKDMRPVRNVNGLLCKACRLGMAGSTSVPQKKHFSFPQLVNHFHTIHEQGLPPDFLGHAPDWTKDMVDLPELSKLTSVVNAPGMDDRKLQIFTEALPELVAPPQSGAIDSQLEPSPAYGAYPDQFGYGQLAPSQDNHEKYYATTGSGRPSDAESVAYDSGEYDPRNPHDLPIDRRGSYKLARKDQDPRDYGNRGPTQPLYQYDSPQVLHQLDAYQERSDIDYVDQRMRPSSRGRPIEVYSHNLVREEPVYMERPNQYQDSNTTEYRIRRDPADAIYDQPESLPPSHGYRAANAQSYSVNREAVPASTYELPPRQSRIRPSEDPASEQSNIFEVVARITQQAQQAREQNIVKSNLAEAGSEDGEVRTDVGARPDPIRSANGEAMNAAERFLNEFVPGEAVEPVTRRRDDGNYGQGNGHASEVPRDYEQAGGNVYQRHSEPRLASRNGYQDDRLYPSNIARPLHSREDDHKEYIIHERETLPRPIRAIAYEDSYPGTSTDQTLPRERSPELVDRRFKLNNVVYRDERQGSHGAHKTAGRYARYESVRLENDRMRSRSPVYVKLGPQAGHYRERSPAVPAMHQESAYRTRTPISTADDVTFERQPRQEYYRVYADEPRQREPQYELVRISDPNGDYMIRRPIRREPEPVYASYDDDLYARQPVYDPRAPPSRAGPPSYEEYDPHHPEPAPAPVRQVRYQ